MHRRIFQMKRTFHSGLRRLVLAPLLLLVPGIGGAQVVRTTPAEALPVVDVAISDGKVLLSLEDAIMISLQRNLGLQVQRYRREQAWYNIERNQGVFDLGLGVNAGQFSEQQPAASQLSGADVTEVEGNNLDFRLDQLVSTGGQFSFIWDNARQESNSIFSSVNPSYTIDWDIAFSQPLLFGFGETATKRNILVARNDSQIGLELLEQAIIADVDQVETAYWALVEAQSQLVVSREGLRLAEDLHEMNQIQVDVGTMAPLELVQSEVGVATQQEEVLRADVLARDSADVLRQLLNLDERLWNTPIEPTTPAIIERITIDVDEAIDIALAERSEVRAQQLRIDNLATDVRFFRNRLKPRLDAQVRYGYNALGGEVNIGGNPFDPRPPQTLEGDYGDAWQQILDRDFTGWAAGLVLSYPMQNREARANKAIADLALDEGETELADLALAILTEVRRSARAVDAAAEAIDLAEISTHLAERNLDAERKRYENGLSTSFRVLEIQEDLTDARSRQVSSIAAYRRALVLFYRSTGRLLPEKGVEISDDVPQQ
jgi:outer membrane protein TolC